MIQVEGDTNMTAENTPLDGSTDAVSTADKNTKDFHSNHGHHGSIIDTNNDSHSGVSESSNDMVIKTEVTSGEDSNNACDLSTKTLSNKNNNSPDSSTNPTISKPCDIHHPIRTSLSL